MSDTAVEEYLKEELIEKGEVITYRILSRKLSLHVNVAKSKLSEFYLKRHQSTSSTAPIYATYLLSGIAHHSATESRRDINGDSMDVDDGDNGQAQQDEVVTREKIMLVPEELLDKTKSSLFEVNSCHIYSLSTKRLDNSSPYRDCLRKLRRLDASGGPSLSSSVGRLALKSAILASGSSKTESRTEEKSSTRSDSKAIEQKKTKPELQKAPPLKPQASGKLDWSRAKTKAPLKKEESNDEDMKPVNTGSSKERGTKRKSPELGDGNVPKNPPPTPAPVIKKEVSPKPNDQTAASSALRVQKGVVLSDDEDSSEEHAKINGARRKNKSKPKPNVSDLESDTERSVRALMDVDDSEVIKVSRSAVAAESAKKTQIEEEDQVLSQFEETQNESEGESDNVPKALPKKRQVKKQVPLGKNGYPKKRVMKSRMVKQGKYMVTEDYSEYESVDEEEGRKAKEAEDKAKEERKNKRLATIAKAQAEANESQSETEKTTKPVRKAAPVKPRASASGQKNIMSFFGGGGGAKGKK